MSSQSVTFPNRDGIDLSGVLETPAGDVRAWALFAHCFTCSKDTLAATRISRQLAERGIGVLRFDFTGLGASGGAFEETAFSTNISDLIDATAWMAQEARPVQLMIGHSLGGAATVIAANALPDIKALVTLAAPSEADHVVNQFKQAVPEIEAVGRAQVDLAGRPFVLTKTFLEDVRGSSVIDAVRTLKRPYLIMHSPTDAVVGVDSATDLFINAKHPKSFVSLDNADHLLNRKEDAEFVASVIVGWSERYLQTVFPEPQVVPKTPFDVTVRETGERSQFQNEVLIDGRRFLADEPVSFGGSATGPDPYAWVTAGLGACTAMTLRMYAARKNWPLDRVTVDLNHSKDHPKDCVDCGPSDKIDVFSRDITLEGDLDEEQRVRLLEIADRCPVHRTLETAAAVETRLVTQSA
ncbi:MAG: bifunctional alpha/beta hydrolase/OsmC family protein [Pseudomonadota bacterium]